MTTEKVFPPFTKKASVVSSMTANFFSVWPKNCRSRKYFPTICPKGWRYCGSRALPIQNIPIQNLVPLRCKSHFRGFINLHENLHCCPLVLKIRPSKVCSACSGMTEENKKPVTVHAYEWPVSVMHNVNAISIAATAAARHTYQCRCVESLPRWLLLLLHGILLSDAVTFLIASKLLCFVSRRQSRTIYRVTRSVWNLVGWSVLWLFHCLPDSAGGNQSELAGQQGPDSIAKNCIENGNEKAIQLNIQFY